MALFLLKSSQQEHSLMCVFQTVLLKNIGGSLNKFVVEGQCLYLCTIKTQLVFSYIDLVIVS